MPKKTKKFIDRKNSVTFNLVHRSQQDPLVADESAPQHVLVPINEYGLAQPSKESVHQLEEQQKYGIYFDDGYNYLQHLRTTSNVTEWEPLNHSNDKKLQLPSSVFASSVEEDVGLLNKAAPSGLRLDYDPDVVAAMDEDFNYEDPDNELEDNFMELANAEGDDLFDDEDDDYAEEARDELESLCESQFSDQFSFREEETKSQFTDYSMSSSVIRRNSQLSLLDDRFEKMYSTYNDSEIGSLDCDEIGGYVSESSHTLLSYADEFNKQRRNEYLDKDMLALRSRLQEECGSSSDDDDLDLVPMREPKSEKWDCESILSTYSNIYNHPKLITEPRRQKIKINPKTGIPKNVISSNKLTAKALSMLNEGHDNTLRMNGSKSEANSVTSILSSLSIRNPHETLQEKKKRKQLLKEYRKERREEKKTNSKAFKRENIRQAKISINNHNNVQGNRIL